MIKTITQYEFTQAFINMNPSDTFTYQGLIALFNYFEEYEKSKGEQIEFNVIGICCEYTEYKNLVEFQACYSNEYETIDDIENATQVIRIDDESFIIQTF